MKTPKETPLPPHGGSWKQDPATGELVLVSETEEPTEAPPVDADKEKQ